jgi:hypothetical protein
MLRPIVAITNATRELTMSSSLLIFGRGWIFPAYAANRLSGKAAPSGKLRSDYTIHAMPSTWRFRQKK